MPLWAGKLELGGHGLMLSWHECPGWATRFRYKALSGSCYLKIQYFRRCQAMDGQAETEAADKQDEKLSLKNQRKRLTQDPARA